MTFAYGRSLPTVRIMAEGSLRFRIHSPRFLVLVVVVLSGAALLFVNSSRSPSAAVVGGGHGLAAIQTGHPPRASRSARRVAREFLAAGGARQNLAIAWRLSTAALHASLPRRAWMTGTIPVVPLALDSVQGAVLRPVLEHHHQVLFEVELRASTLPGAAPTAYLMQLADVRGRWLVTYLAPRGEGVPLPAS
jgi:hypothetical protein